MTLIQGQIIERFYKAAYDPVYFDRGNLSRFNAPDGSYGVLYAAETVQGAFAETFLRTPASRLLPIDVVRNRARASLRISRELTLVKLTGTGLARLGATAEVTHGGLPYCASQAWSMALKSHAIKPDGIAYRARHDDEALCYALFEQAPSPVQEVSRFTDLDREDWFWQEAHRYGVGIAP